MRARRDKARSRDNRTKDYVQFFARFVLQPFDVTTSCNLELLQRCVIRLIYRDSVLGVLKWDVYLVLFEACREFAKRFFTSSSSSNMKNTLQIYFFRDKDGILDLTQTFIT